MAEEVQVVEKKSGGGLIIVLLIIMILLIVGVAVMAFLLLSSDKGENKSGKVVEEQHGDASHGESIPEKETSVENAVLKISEKYKQYEPPEPGAAPQYFAMKPFVVNFKGEGKARFLAVTIKFMTHYPQLIDDMESYRPMLRNDITGLLRVQTYTEMYKDDGPDILRKKIIDKAKVILEKQGIFPDVLEDVYFERFVMQ